jgi:spore coat polysaccharide biosynthesis protein SpsF
MLRYVAIVESRMTSRRLPGKNMRLLAERPMVVQLLDRLSHSNCLSAVCLATSSDHSDDPLESVAHDSGVACHRGSLEDVLARVLGAAKFVGAEAIVEITGDCPLVCPEIIDAAIRRFEKGDADYLANMLDRLSFPIGFDVQIYRTELLEEVSTLTADLQDRVDVTPFIHRNGEKYKLLNTFAPVGLDRPHYRLCVDYLEDFQLISKIFEQLQSSSRCFNSSDVIEWLDANPDIARMNVNDHTSFGFPTSAGLALQEELSMND